MARIALFFFPLLPFLFQTEGFDLYHHTTSYYFQIPINYGYLILDNTILPRYLILSDYYTFMSAIGLPLGWAILILCGLPCYIIMKSEYWHNIGDVNTKIILQFIVFILCLFYSSMSLMLLWLFAYRVSHKHFFLISLMFHPVGILFALAIVWHEKSIKLILSFIGFVASYILFCYIKTTMNFPFEYAYTPVRYELHVHAVLNLAELALSAKAKEIVGFIVIAFFSQRLIKMYNNKSVQFSFRSRIVLASYFFFLTMILTLFIQTWNKDPILYRLLGGNVTDVIYVSWFDWGSADYSGSFLDLAYERIQ